MTGWILLSIFEEPPRLKACGEKGRIGFCICRVAVCDLRLSFALCHLLPALTACRLALTFEI